MAGLKNVFNLYHRLIYHGTNKKVEVVTLTTANLLNNPHGHEQIAAAFMTQYGVDMKKAQSLSSGYLDAVMSK